MQRGWIRGGAQRLEARAISFPHREGDPEYLEALRQIVRLEALHSLPHCEPLMQVMRQVLGDSAFPHPLGITRLVFPRTPELSTPPHQDFPNNQGTPGLTAAWIPLADCSLEQGSLAVLEGSHRHGLQPLAFHLGPGNRSAVLGAELSGCRWLGADFKAGDIVLFPALTVHRALDNRDPERMRLSVDYRYQLEGEALTEGCLRPHFDCLDWADIYRDWRSRRYQYYWRQKEYRVVPWDESLHRLPEGHMDEALRQELRFLKAARERLVGTPASTGADEAPTGE